MTELFISIQEIAQLSGFKGSINNDSIRPFVFMAQNSEIKRILGLPLYNKITTDYTNNSLTGAYKDIFDNYIQIIEVYFTCSFWLQLGTFEVSQNGAYLITPDKTEQLTEEQKDAKAGKYEKMAVGLEIKFLEYLDELNLPERPAPGTVKPKSNFNWKKVK